MNHELTKRHVDALRKLCEECDYEDYRSDGEQIFVLRDKLSPGIGDKTLSDLEGWRLIEAGTNKWFGTLGYRITELGRHEFERFQQKLHKPNTTNKLRPLPSRLGKSRVRFER